MYPLTAERILVIQLRQVGDVLLTTPAVKVLREACPNAHLSYLTEEGPAKLLQGNPHIDELLIRDRHGGIFQDIKLIRRLQKEKFDLLIDFFCNPRSGWIALFSGATDRIAAYHAGRSWYYTQTPNIPSGIGYAPEDRLALLRAVGIKGELHAPVLMVPESARRYIENFITKKGILKKNRRAGGPLVTIDPTSRRQAKRWIPERYARLADLLTEKHDARVMFLWGPGEKEMLQEFLQCGTHQHLLAPPTDLMQLAALIEESDLHIGNCSAPRHIAVAVGTPSLTVMGPTKPENWTYPDSKHQVVQGDVPCLGCQKTVCGSHDCMKVLTVQTVFEAAEPLIGKK